MQHVVTTPPAPFSAMEGRLVVHAVPVWVDNLVWIGVCTETGSAFVVDGPDAAPVLAHCETHGIELTTILTTHVHPDHIGLHSALENAGTLSSYRVVGSRAAPMAIPGLTDAVDGGDEIVVGALTGRVIRVDGHQDGHVAYLFGDALFCGDTLFTGGCGYLFDGPASAMFDSLLRLAELPGDTRVCCAHEYTQDNLRFAWTCEPGNEALAERIRQVWAARAEGRTVVPSTLEEERATNPFLRPGSPELIERVRTAMPEADLSSPLGVFTATRAWKDRGDHKALGDDALPL